MQVTINGKTSEMIEKLSVRDVITERKLPVTLVIIELNGEIIKRELWDNLKLNPGDNLEIIRIIGGG